MYNDNLVSVDVDTLDRYLPGVYSAVQQNCRKIDDNTTGKNCCNSTCASICGNPSSNCDKGWKDICDSECDDIFQTIKDKNQPKPLPSPESEDSLQGYCDCINESVPPGEDISRYGQELMSCCMRKNISTDCDLYMARKPPQQGCLDPRPTPRPFIRPDPTPDPTPVPKPNTSPLSGLSSLSTIEKTFLYGGISLLVILVIILIYLMVIKH